MAKYGVIRTDSVPTKIRSAKYYVSTTTTAIENGNIVQVDELLSASANREIFKAIAPTAVTNINVGVVASPEIIYDETTKAGGALDQFVNAAGKPITVIFPEKGKFLSISDECITVIDDDDDKPAVGNFVTITANSTKWTEKASLGGTETLAGKIVARELYKANTYLNVLEIVVGY
jgi:hypothetical protein